jgi:hypothetical protein
MAAATIALLHFALSWVSFTRSAAINPSGSTPLWRGISEVLAFPLDYLSNALSALDIFPILMIVNSLLWGVVAAFIVIAFARFRALQA